MRRIARWLALVVPCLPVGAQEASAVEKVAGGFQFVEGPAWDPVRGRLLFSDIPAGKILALGDDGEVTTWLEPSGRSNGLVFDAEGNLYACLGGAREIVRIAADGARTVLAERYRGKRLNSPNDLCLDAHGGVYFTDPRYGDANDLEQDLMAVYYVARDASIERVVDSLPRPNGILLARDGGGLYVAEPDRRELWFFPVLRPGELGEGRVIFRGDPELDGGGPDGMAMDAEGRIYTTYAGIVVHEADGRVIRRIAVPERPANCTLGGADGRTLWITARTGLYRTRVDAKAAPLRSGRIVEPPVIDPPRFERQVVDADVGIGYGVALADVDGDRRDDIVLVDRHEIAWYANPGFARSVLAERLTPRDHVCVAARDLDGDGRAELAVGAGWNPSDTAGSGSVHWLAPGDDRRARWTPVALHHEPTVHRMRWVRGVEGWQLVVVPLHGRDNRRGRGAGVRILAYDPPPDRGAPWPTSLVDDALHETHNVDPVQWDDDDASELLVASREGLFVLDPTAKGPWRRTALTSTESGERNFRGASEVRAGRLEDGSRFIATIEPFHGNELVVYRPPEPGSPRGFWIRSVLADDLSAGHAVACGDVLGLGADQIVVGWRQPNASGAVGLRIYAPGDGGRAWRAIPLDGRTACEDLRLGDLDGDGRIDVVACGRASHDLVVFWNRGR